MRACLAQSLWLFGAGLRFPPELADHAATGAVALAAGRRLDAAANAVLGPVDARRTAPLLHLDEQAVSRHARLDETMETWSIATALHAEHAAREATVPAWLRSR